MTTYNNLSLTIKVWNWNCVNGSFLLHHIFVLLEFKWNWISFLHFSLISIKLYFLSTPMSGWGDWFRNRFSTLMRVESPPAGYGMEMSCSDEDWLSDESWWNGCGLVATAAGGLCTSTLTGMARLWCRLPVKSDLELKKKLIELKQN